MFVAHTFMFSGVFETRWGTEFSSKVEFAILPFPGMIVHSLFAECLSRASVLIVQNVSYVKKFVFPLEILPCVSLGSAMFHASASIGMLLVFFTLSHWFLNWTAVFLPLLLPPLAVMCFGLSWFLASLGVFSRDVGHATEVVSTILLFLSPVFYPVSAVSERYRFLVNLNPLTFIIEQVRDVLVWGKLPNWGALAEYCVVSTLVAWLGFV
jgi:lipopolysaccharide transport system permease protein